MRHPYTVYCILFKAFELVDTVVLLVTYPDIIIGEALPPRSSGIRPITSEWCQARLSVDVGSSQVATLRLPTFGFLQLSTIGTNMYKADGDICFILWQLYGPDSRLRRRGAALAHSSLLPSRDSLIHSRLGALVCRKENI